MTLVSGICLPYLLAAGQLKVMPGLQGICPSYSWVAFWSISPQFAEPECTWWFTRNSLLLPIHLPFYNLLGLDSHVVLPVTLVVPVVVDALDVSGKHFYALSLPCFLTCDSTVSSIPYNQAPTAPFFVYHNFVWRLFLTTAHHLCGIIVSSTFRCSKIDLEFYVVYQLIMTVQFHHFWSG